MKPVDLQAHFAGISKRNLNKDGIEAQAQIKSPGKAKITTTAPIKQSTHDLDYEDEYSRNTNTYGTTLYKTNEVNLSEMSRPLNGKNSSLTSNSDWTRGNRHKNKITPSIMTSINSDISTSAKAGKIILSEKMLVIENPEQPYTDSNVRIKSSLTVPKAE